jgi:60 kDa SS-A/Ro ribonucleoprotein
MSKTNVPNKQPAVYTHEGARAANIGPEQELRRSVAACLLWEDNFYESGVGIAARIKGLVPLCRPEFVAAVAYEARTRMKLRHAPLLLVREMARNVGHRLLVSKLLPDIIQRADELSEFVAIYWKDDASQPLSKQVKTGLARAFPKFGEYALAKYDRPGAVKLRDVLFMCHAKPQDEAQAALWKKLVDGTLQTPDTWEVALSELGTTPGMTEEEKVLAKKAAWERLMAEEKLGALAFLRNLRNMKEAGVALDTIKAYATSVDITRVLPFRFLAAARAVPEWEHIIEPMMLRACLGREKLPGRTVVLIDVSGSMDAHVSLKSDINRLDAACGVAILLRELCEDVGVLTFSDQVANVPPRRGFALRDSIIKSQAHSGTYLGKAVETVNAANHVNGKPDRLIVLTDEQSADRVPDPLMPKAYMVNVAAHKNGVGYGKWYRCDGWSEAIIDYIQEIEKVEASRSTSPI